MLKDSPSAQVRPHPGQWLFWYPETRSPIAICSAGIRAIRMEVSACAKLFLVRIRSSLSKMAGTYWSRPGVIAHYAEHGKTLTVSGGSQGSMQVPDAVDVQAR